MNRFSLLYGLAAGSLMVAAVAADAPNDQPKEIPLDQIWGYNLPGTRDVTGMPFPGEKGGIGQTYAFLNKEREYNIEQVRLALAMKPPGEKAMHGFVLPGKLDSHTLLGVHPPLRGKPGPFKQNSFPSGEELTLAFFSHPLSYRARLRKVEREGNQFTVYYQFEPHTTPEATVHFALIPLGKLPPGEYRVTYKQEPVDEKYRKAGFEPVHPEATEIVCRDFSFTVLALPKVEAIEGATPIPLNQTWGYKIPGTRDASELDAVNAESGTSHPLIDAWQRLMWDRFKKRETAGPAFVVKGLGREALVNALAAFDEEPTRAFSKDADLCLVFYTHSIGSYVQIDRIERIAKTVIIEYRFVSHLTRNMSFHFDLIPLGKLPVGEYQVVIKQLPPIDASGRTTTLARDLTDRVSRDGSFYIREEGP